MGNIKGLDVTVEAVALDVARIEFTSRVMAEVPALGLAPDNELATTQNLASRVEPEQAQRRRAATLLKFMKVPLPTWDEIAQTPISEGQEGMSFVGRAAGRYGFHHLGATEDSPDGGVIWRSDFRYGVMHFTNDKSSPVGQALALHRNVITREAGMQVGRWLTATRNSNSEIGGTVFGQLNGMDQSEVYFYGKPPEPIHLHDVFWTELDTVLYGAGVATLPIVGEGNGEV